MNQMKSLIYSVLAWGGATGLYLLIRFYGTKDSMEWTVSPEAFIQMWLMASLLLGCINYFSNRISDLPAIRQRSYGFIVLIKVVLLVTGAYILLLLARLVAVYHGQIAWDDVIPVFMSRVTHKVTIVCILYIAIVSAILGFIRQMRIMIGPRTLRNLVLGKYHHPKEENRIFMFLDLKGSTTHAEKLGHTKFCRLIQDCFRDLTDSAIKHQVEIYQYVGDEAILTWLIDDGVRNSNCINVYFEFQDDLKAKGDYYQKHYGLVPEFKAGVNMGPVTVAEIGVIKRECNRVFRVSP